MDTRDEVVILQENTTRRTNSVHLLVSVLDDGTTIMGLSPGHAELFRDFCKMNNKKESDYHTTLAMGRVKDDGEIEWEHTSPCIQTGIYRSLAGLALKLLVLGEKSLPITRLSYQP